MIFTLLHILAVAVTTLSIVGPDGRVEWWRSDRAPTAWTAPHPTVSAAFQWRPLAPGMDMAEAPLHVNGGLLRLRVIAVRIDPSAVRLELVRRTAANGITAAWSVDEAPDSAIFAVNAGQFEEAGPWGWVVMQGRERQAPGRGPLAVGLAVHASGEVTWIPDESIDRARQQLRPRAAFQSWPLLLRADGSIPQSVRTAGLMDLDHRDTRLAVGQLADGRLLFVMTRFAGAGALLERLPAGLTTPEMAALMGAMGTRPAVMLDGGLSAQMLVRDDGGEARKWRGGRRVPLGLVAFPATPPR